MRTFLYGNSIGLSMVAFASYFDVYSHRHLFVGTDPWWNPAHLMLYAGFVVIAYGVAKGRPRDVVGRVSVVGIVVVLAAAGFNEVWHRVLLFGNPLPEPFPVEPPHALLAVGFILVGVAAILAPLKDPAIATEVKDRIALAFTSGSMWLIVAGSAFYIGGAYSSTPSYLIAVGAASFAASLFLAYPAAIVKRFGYSTLAYLWFLLVYYVFFISWTDGLPYGLALVLVIDFVLVRRRIIGVDSRLLVLALIALLYGVIYYPIIDIGSTVALNAGLVASAVGVGAEFAFERRIVRAKILETAHA